MFYDPEKEMCPEAQPSETSPVEGSQNILPSRGPSKLVFYQYISSVKVNDSIKKTKTVFVEQNDTK